MLTRKEVAQRIGKSVSTVRRMEGDTLNPILADDGVHYFYEDEVEEARKTILESGRALPHGQAQEALDLARSQKQELVDNLEAAEVTIRQLRQQISELQHRIAMRRYEEGAGPGPYFTLYRGLREDVDFLIRRIPAPSFQTELAIARVTTILKSL